MTLPKGEDGNVDRLSVEPDDIDTAADAASMLGVQPDASDSEISVAYRELTMELHPDQGGSEKSFVALGVAQDLLEEYPGGDWEDAERYERYEGAEADRQDSMGRYTRGGATTERETGTTGFGEEQQEAGPADMGGFGGAGGPGPAGGFAQEEWERYRDTVEDIKLTFLESILQKDLSDYDTVEEAQEAGWVTNAEIGIVEDTLADAYNAPGITLEEIAKVVASLVVTGAINLGEERFFTDRAGSLGNQRSGSLGGSGNLGGSGTGSLGR